MKPRRNHMPRLLVSMVVGATGALTACSVPSKDAPTYSSKSSDCRARGTLNFLCGTPRPEDVVRIPGTAWLIYSGFSDGAGLKLVNTAARTMQQLEVLASDTHEKPPWSQCDAAPAPAFFNTQGLTIRDLGGSRSTLHVVNHGERESIEIFSVDTSGPEPRISWIGCVRMPQGLAANSVATFTDGTILASVLTHPGRTITDFWRGEVTGGVYAWSPGDEEFRLLRGTELPGNNGIETSADDKEFYVVAFGWRSVVVFSRYDTSEPLRRAVAPGFMPDNIHRIDGEVVLAGMQYDEPACGGVRKIINGVADSMRCHRGYTVARCDPASLDFAVLAYAEPDPDFNGVSAATIVGQELWLASYQADRIAWRALPVPGAVRAEGGSAPTGSMAMAR